MTNVKLDKHPLPIGVKNVKNSNSDFPTRTNVSLFFQSIGFGTPISFKVDASI